MRPHYANINMTCITDVTKPPVSSRALVGLQSNGYLGRHMLSRNVAEPKKPNAFIRYDLSRVRAFRVPCA